LRKSECHEYLIVSLPRDKNEPEHPELEPLGEPIDIKAPWLMREEIEINPEVGPFDDFPQARFWTANEALTDARITSALPTIRKLSQGGSNRNAECGTSISFS
jgi:hypothetical protein